MRLIWAILGGWHGGSSDLPWTYVWKVWGTPLKAHDPELILHQSWCDPERPNPGAILGSRINPGSRTIVQDRIGFTLWDCSGLAWDWPVGIGLGLMRIGVGLLWILLCRIGFCGLGQGLDVGLLAAAGTLLVWF